MAEQTKEKSEKVVKKVTHCTHWKNEACTLGRECPGHECYDYAPRITNVEWYPHKR